MDKYIKKQFKIAGVFLVIILLIVGIIWFLNKPTRGTCFDEEQNQGEIGIDCGGPCGPCEESEDLVILLEELIPTVPSDFDLVAKIRNPNKNWGVESLDYKFNIYDSNGELTGTRQGKTHLLPQETKYIIEQRMTTKMDSVRTDIELSNINWLKLKDFEELELIIRDKELQVTEQGFSKLIGSIDNKSSYNLSKAEINGVLFSNGEIVAAGKTEIETVLMSEVRYFEISWPYKIIGEITSSELKPHTNVFLNENFLKTHGTTERFKEY